MSECGRRNNAAGSCGSQVVLEPHSMARSPRLHGCQKTSQFLTPLPPTYTHTPEPSWIADLPDLASQGG